MKRVIFKLIFLIFCTFIQNTSYASLQIKMYLTNGSGQYIGTVKADDTIYGLLLTPNLKGLSPGLHGFHIHECGLCKEKATLTGNHLDFADSKTHRGPYRGNGHTGDLPPLFVDKSGKATLPVLAPRLKLSQVVGRSLLVHAGSDNYSDHPEKNGGGGAKIVCGEIPYH